MEEGHRPDADRLAAAGEDREAVLGEILARERERLRRMVRGPGRGARLSFLRSQRNDRGLVRPHSQAARIHLHSARRQP